MKKFILLLFLSFNLLVSPSGVFAANNPGPPPPPKGDGDFWDIFLNFAPPDLLCGQEKEINTAIGCIPFGSTNDFIAYILRWAIGIGGGIAFLLIIYAGFMIMTSSGNPERLKAGQELLTSAIMGLILLIFSVFILRIIGVEILRIPGLESP